MSVGCKVTTLLLFLIFHFSLFPFHVSSCQQANCLNNSFSVTGIQTSTIMDEVVVIGTKRCRIENSYHIETTMIERLIDSKIRVETDKI